MKITLPNRNLDEYLLKYREPGTELVLEPGVYTTQGAWRFEVGGEILPGIAPGVRLDASQATIVLRDAVRREGNSWVAFPWIGHRAELRLGKVILEDHPGMHVSGFHALGSCRIIGGELTGLKGSHSGDKEVFAYTQVPGDGSTRIEGLKVHSHVDLGTDTYVSGPYLNDHGAIATDCVVDMPGSQFAYSSCLPATFRRCHGKSHRFWYTDTGDGVARLEECSGILTYAGISSVAVDQGRIRKVFATRCDWDCSGARIVELDRSPGGSQTGWVVLHECQVKAQYRVATTDPDLRAFFFGGSIEAPDEYVAAGALRPEIHA